MWLSNTGTRRLAAVAVVVVAVVVVAVAAELPTSPPPPTPPLNASTLPPSLIMGEPCPIVELAPDFNSSAFAGQWYKFGGLPNLQELSTRCTKYDYQYTGSGYVVEENGVDAGGERVTQRSNFSQPDEGVGEFVTKVEGLEAHLQVLTTDYTSMACLYTCHTVRDAHRVHFAWILSRDTSLAKEKIAACQVQLKKVKVPLRQMEKTDQGPECV